MPSTCLQCIDWEVVLLEQSFHLTLKVCCRKSCFKSLKAFYMKCITFWKEQVLELISSDYIGQGLQLFQMGVLYKKLTLIPYPHTLKHGSGIICHYRWCTESQNDPGWDKKTAWNWSQESCQEDLHHLEPCSTFVTHHCCSFGKFWSWEEFLERFRGRVLSYRPHIVIIGVFTSIIKLQYV